MGDEYRVDGLELPADQAEGGSDDRLGAEVRERIAKAAAKSNERDEDED